MTSVQITVLFIFCATLASCTRLQLIQDVTITNDDRNNNHIPYLIVGLHPGFPNKRSLLQFTNPPSNCQVSSAKLYINLVYTHRGSAFTWQQAPLFPRTIIAHRVLKPWRESEATAFKALSTLNWSHRFLGLGSDVVYNPTSAAGVIVYPPFQKGQKWYGIDVTIAVRDWKNGQPNYGLLIRALHEDRPGHDFRFARDNAYIQVVCAGRSSNQGGKIFPPLGNGKVGPNGEIQAI